MRRNKAFTLVEVLVVLGLTGVLLALLLSALSNVWRAARAVSCAANLQQLGQAMTSYTTDNRGVLPAAATTYEWTPPVVMRMTTWDDLLARYIEGPISGARQAQLDGGFTPDPSPLLRCPEDERTSPPFAGLRSYSMTDAGYSASRRPVYGLGVLVSDDLPPDLRMHRIRLAQLRHTSRTLLLVENHSGTAGDGNLAGFIYLAAIPYPSAQRMDVSGPNAGKPSGPPAHAARWNYLFCDGHVEQLAPRETVRPLPGLGPDELLNLRNGMWSINPDDPRNR